MTGWRSVSLGAVATLQAGIGFPEAMQGRPDGDYPVAKVGDISRAGRAGVSPLGTADHYVNECDLKGLGAKPIPAGSVLFAKIGMAIRQNHRVIAGRSLLIDNNAMAAIPGTEINSRYLYHFLRTQDFFPLASTTTVPSLRKSDLAKVQVPLPPLPEQRRIAAILDKADELRAKRRAALGQLSGLRTSAFVSLFGESDSVLDRWQVVGLGDKLAFLTSGSRGWAKHYRSDGALFLRIENVRRDELRLDDVTFVDAPDTAEAKRTRVQPGDVLMSITADLGRTAVISDDLGTAYINQHLAILRTDAWTSRFLSAFLASEAGRRQILSKNRQGVKAGLNFDDIRSLRIPSPPRALQSEFQRQMNVVDHLEALHRRSGRTFDAAFASLQYQAFAGEL